MTIDPEFLELLGRYREAALRHVDEKAAPVIEQRRRAAQEAQSAFDKQRRASDARQTIVNQAKDLILTGDDADHEKGMRLMSLQAKVGLDFTHAALDLRETIPGVTDKVIHEIFATEAEASPADSRLQGVLEVSSLVTVHPVEETREPHYPF